MRVMAVEGEGERELAWGGVEGRENEEIGCPESESGRKKMRRSKKHQTPV